MAEGDWSEIAAPLLRAAGLTAPIAGIEPLTGGVSSDIVRITLADGTLACAKRALARLKVASVWEAPLERNHYEVAWLRVAGGIAPTAVPRVLGEDQAQDLLAPRFQHFPPEQPVQRGDDLARRSVGIGRELARAVQHRPHGMHHELLEEVLLAAEVEVERALGDAGPRRDIVEARGRETLRREHVERGVEDRLAPVLALFQFRLCGRHGRSF